MTQSVRDTMSSTIRVSSNEGYMALRRQFGRGPIASLASSVGGVSFDLSRNYPYMTTKDMAKLWVGTYDYFWVSTNGNSAWCRSLYTSPYLSFIHSALGASRSTYTKPGWISESGYVARNDAGVVVADGRPYLTAIMSTAYGQDANLMRLASALDAVHASLG